MLEKILDKFFPRWHTVAWATRETRWEFSKTKDTSNVFIHFYYLRQSHYGTRRDVIIETDEAKCSSVPYKSYLSYQEYIDGKIWKETGILPKNGYHITAVQKKEEPNIVEFCPEPSKKDIR